MTREAGDMKKPILFIVALWVAHNSAAMEQVDAHRELNAKLFALLPHPLTFSAHQFDLVILRTVPAPLDILGIEDFFSQRTIVRGIQLLSTIVKHNARSSLGNLDEHFWQSLICGADLDAKDEKGFSLLIIASLLEDVTLCKLLVEGGADVQYSLKDRSSDIFISPLVIALALRSEKLCSLLMEHQVTIDPRFGLLLAAQSGSRALCQLFSAKVDYDFMCKCLVMAARCGSKDVCEFLVGLDADVNSHLEDAIWTLACEDVMTPLMWAAARGDIPMCDFLIEKGAEVNLAPNIEKFTPLSLALRTGDAGMCAFLISRGAHVSRDDLFSAARRHNCAVLETVFEGVKDVCALLKPTDFEIIEKVRSHDRALEKRLEKSKLRFVYERVGALIKWNSTVRSPELIRAVCAILELGEADHLSCLGYTQLMWAAIHNQAVVCRFFLENGADVSLLNKQGFGAFRVACNQRSLDVCDVLVGTCGVEKACVMPSDITEALSKYSKDARLKIELPEKILRNRNVVIALLNAFLKMSAADLKKAMSHRNCRISIESKALLCAVLYGVDDIVQLLLARGADLNVCDKRGHTGAVSWAIKAGHTTTSLLLIENGASLANGYPRPLTVALRKNQIGLAEIILQNDSSWDSKELDRVVERKSTDQLETLLSKSFFNPIEDVPVAPVIFTALLCFNRESKGLPKDIRYKIFCSEQSLAEQLFKEYVNRVSLEKRTHLRDNRYLKKELLCLLISSGFLSRDALIAILAGCTIRKIKEILVKKHQSVNTRLTDRFRDAEEIETMIDPECFEQNFRERIYAHTRSLVFGKMADGKRNDL